MSEQEREMTERKFTEKEVCEVYQVDRGTLRGWRKLGIIKHLRLPSGQIRYKQSHLDEFDRKMEHRRKADAA